MIKINPEFKHLIPPLLPEEYKQLEENILSEGQCRDAIILWKNFIVDGHNRYEICQKHGIRFEVCKMNFASKDDAMVWIIENQLGRRNLTDALKIELAIRKTEMLSIRAKENLQAGGGDMREPKNHVDEPINVRKEIAAAAGLSEQKVYRYMKIIGNGTDEMIAQLRKGEIKIGTAFNKLQAVSRKVTVIYDDADFRNRDSGFGRDNVLGFIDRLGSLYEFLGDVVEVDGSDGVLGTVERGVRRCLFFNK